MKNYKIRTSFVSPEAKVAGNRKNRVKRINKGVGLPEFPFQILRNLRSDGPSRYIISITMHECVILFYKNN